MSRRLEASLVAILVLIGAAIRLYRLDQWQWDGNEFATLSDVMNRLEGNIETPSRIRSSSWMTTWLLSWPWRWIDSRETALRILPCLGGILVLILSYIPIKRIWNREVALAWLCLMALSPLATHASSYAGYQSFVLALGTVVIVATCHAVEFRRGRPLILAVSALLLAAAFHFSALILLPPFLLIIVLLPALQKRRAPAWVSLFLLAVSLTAVSLWFRDPVSSVVENVASSLLSRQIRYSPWHLLGSSVFQIGFGVSLFAAFGAWRAIGSSSIANRLLIPFGLLPVLTLWISSFYLSIGPRYLFAAVPALYLLAALGVGHLLRGLPASSLMTRGAILAIALSPQVPTLASNLIAANSRYEIRSFGFPLMQDRTGPRDELARDVILAESHAVFSHYFRLPTIELPWTVEHIRPMVEGRNRVFIIAHFQRGRLIGVTDPTLQAYLEQRCYLCNRWVSRRFDLYRFETRLYCNRRVEEALVSGNFRKEL